jgi:flagellar biosynthesis/type III secretory pathway protein FliH
LHHKENSTPDDVCISQLQLSSIAHLCSHQAGSKEGYKTGLQAEYQAGFRLGSDKVFKSQQALQWTPYCYNSHVVKTGIPPSLATSLI